MIFMKVTPEIHAFPTSVQEVPINLTSAARTHYTNKAARETNVLVTVNSITVPEGVLVGGTTQLFPELYIQSLDEGALKEYAHSFFTNEEHPTFTLVRVFRDEQGE